MLPELVARLRRQCVHSEWLFETPRPARLRDAMLRRVKVAPVKVTELARVWLRRRRVVTVPQGGLPWVSPVSAYSVHDGPKYTQENINRRLIDHRKLMAGFENVAFAATSMK